MKAILKAILTIGVSASGKSTWAANFVKENEPDWRLICSDDIRAKMFRERKGVDFRWSLWRKHLKWEKDVRAEVWSQVEAAKANNENVVIANTHLNQKTLTGTQARLIELGFDVSTKEFHISFEEAVTRDAERLNGVGSHVIAHQFDLYHKMFTRQYTPIDDTEEAILIDVDGTLAHNVSGRSPFDWNRVDEDALDKNVARVLRGMAEDTRIIILSGRDGCCRQQTEQWLHDNGISFDKLLMRAEGDMRSDQIVKEEIFWDSIAPHYNVQFVIDDRPKVCRMWRSIGLKVFQVGNPHIEF